MHTNHKREDPITELGYETRDVSLPGLAKATVYFFGFAIFSGILGWIFLSSGIHLGPIQIDGMDPSYIAKKPNTMRKIPASPNPLLQNNVSAKVEISEMRNEEDTKLNGTAYANADQSKVRIPIDSAMNILVRDGIKKVGTAVPAKTVGHTTEKVDTVPTSPNGGM
jgi:hypothetical protein